MWQLALLVLDDATKLDGVLDAWVEMGVRGATILESSGLARRRGYLQDDVPLFPSFNSLLQSGKNENLTIFAIIDEAVEVERLLERTEAITGELNNPQTGVFFVAPLTFVKGVRPYVAPEQA